MTTAFIEVREFKAGPGAEFSDESAAKYGRFLENKVGLGRRAVAPEEVVKAARPKRSPIHECFTWDDDVAADQWRVSEARHLVRHIVVVVQVDEDTEVRSRAFHSVTVNNGETKKGYISETLVWARPELAEQVVAKALRELEGWRERYATYSDLAAVIEKVDEILAEAA